MNKTSVANIFWIPLGVYVLKRRVKAYIGLMIHIIEMISSTCILDYNYIKCSLNKEKTSKDLHLNSAYLSFYCLCWFGVNSANCPQENSYAEGEVCK